MALCSNPTPSHTLPADKCSEQHTDVCSNPTQSRTLLVLTGPTGVGKTELSLRLAEYLHCPIINADSRQIYREIPIGTAAPTAEEQQRVRHYFVGTHSLTEDYNAGQYERDVLQLLPDLFQENQVVILSGGSMLYIDAVCKGLDDIPTATAELRAHLRQAYEANGLAWLQEEVQRLDPAYWAEADKQNPQRLLHCLEVCQTAGVPYSTLRKQQTAARPFRIVKVGLTRPRAELYDRINRRVVQMMTAGLEEEARRVYPLRTQNSLQTVGYRELFAYFDGAYGKQEAVALIQQNSRHYAKRQLTWFRRDTEMHWLDLSRPADTTDTTNEQDTKRYETQMDTIMHWLRTDSL